MGEIGLVEFEIARLEFGFDFFDELEIRFFGVGIVGVAFRGPDSRTASYPDGGSPGGPAPRWEDAT